ncbi:MAG: YdcH family protein [bacterium]|nr:YdcH family protein [bacterium]
MTEPRSSRFDDVRDFLEETDEDFRMLLEKHQEIDHLVAKLEVRAYLYPREESVLKSMKKKKLHLKDRMMDMINHYRERMNSEIDSYIEQV